jgi:chaperonin GroES
MKIRPLFDRVIATIDPKESTVTKSGIFIVDKGDNKDKKTLGTVIAVGAGKVLQDGTRQEPEVKEGDQIMFSIGAAQLVKVENQDYYFIKEEDIFGVL